MTFIVCKKCLEYATTLMAKLMKQLNDRDEVKLSPLVLTN
jgi:hypothetical protein